MKPAKIHQDSRAAMQRVMDALPEVVDMWGSENLAQMAWKLGEIVVAIEDCREKQVAIPPQNLDMGNVPMYLLCDAWMTFMEEDYPSITNILDLTLSRSTQGYQVGGEIRKTIWN